LITEERYGEPWPSRGVQRRRHGCGDHVAGARPRRAWPGARNSADAAWLFLNLFFLLWVVAIPFATATMAEYLTAGGQDAQVSMVIYTAVFEGMGLAFALIFEWTRG
jgi:hypothetical protein